MTSRKPATTRGRRTRVALLIETSNVYAREFLHGIHSYARATRQMNYTNLTDSMYKGMTMQRSASRADWHSNDDEVLADYNCNGGVGIPDESSRTPW